MISFLWTRMSTSFMPNWLRNSWVRCVAVVHEAVASFSTLTTKVIGFSSAFILTPNFRGPKLTKSLISRTDKMALPMADHFSKFDSDGETGKLRDGNIIMFSMISMQIPGNSGRREECSSPTALRASLGIVIVRTRTVGPERRYLDN